MGKLKKAIATVGGLAVGLVTLRALRKRRSDGGKPTEAVEEELEAAEEDVEKAEAELETATEHATAAVEHAGAAAKKAIEARREKAE
jgi:ribosome recycling factor